MLPPVARLALAFAGGAALALLPGRFSLPALFAVLLALAPIRTSWRPEVRAALVLVALAGALAAWGTPARHAAPTPSPGWAVTYREGLAHRVERLYGAQAPLVNALTLARRDGLDPGVREDFARSGTAHLLAISGFHVGVVAGLILTLFRGAGVARRWPPLGAAGGAWLYVGLLGFPDAAFRAASAGARCPR